MIASSRTGVSSAVSRRACVPANPSFGLPSLSRNSRIVRRSPFSVAFKKDDGDTEEQRKDNFRKEVQDGLERIADHVENIDRTSGNAPSELDLDQQPIPIPESLRRVGKTGKAPVHMQYMAQYWGPRGWAVFSRLREIWAGRLAMVGFMAACVSEIFTHKGVMTQMQEFTGLPMGAVQLVFVGFVLHGLAGALMPNSPTYSNKNLQDVINRPIGYGGLTARTGWGFSKKNELMNGRLAMLGISAALLLEGASGGLGPLGQLAWWAGLQPTDEFYGTASMVLMGWAVLSTGLAVVKGNWGGQLIAGDEDVY